MSLEQVKQPTADKVPFPSETRKALRKNPNVQQVANGFGIDRSTVYRHAEGMDLRLIRSFKALDLTTASMVKMVSEELKQSNADVARILGVSEAFVSGVLSDD